MYRKLEGANPVGALLSYSTWRRRWKENQISSLRIHGSSFPDVKWQLWELGHLAPVKANQIGTDFQSAIQVFVAKVLRTHLMPLYTTWRCAKRLI